MDDKHEPIAYIEFMQPMTVIKLHVLSLFERFMAKRIGARTTEIEARQVFYISHPKEIANLIIEAANSAVK